MARSLGRKSISRLLATFGAHALLALAVGCGGGGGEADPAGLGTAPTLAGIVPAGGSVAGGTAVTLRGSGFQANRPGTVTVMIGGVAAGSPIVVDDTTLLAVTPPRSAGPADVTVVTGNGQASLPGAYVYDATPGFLFAADGKGAVAGKLYRVDPLTADATEIGDIGFAVTGLAMAPDGALYGTESTKQNSLGVSRLLRIDKATGAGSVVGPLLDSTGDFVHGAVADITYVGGRLIGWSESGDVPVEIDRATGIVTIIGDSVSSRGDGLATGGPTTLYFAPETNAGALYVLNPETGTSVAGPTLNGGLVTPSVIGAMAMLDRTLFGVANHNQGPTAPRNSELISIDPTTGAITSIGLLPAGVDAIVGSRP